LFNWPCFEFRLNISTSSVIAASRFLHRGTL
jgi:hypothetical protein